MKSAWQPSLVEIYGRLKTDKPEQQLQTAEHWLKQQGSNAMLLLCLGRLAVRFQLWGKAKTYLQQALDFEPPSDARYEYGELLLVLNENQNALEQFRLGLANLQAV